MPSPFPGMDPFIEGQRWEHFHGEFIYEIHRALMPQLAPRYISVVGERVYVEWLPEPFEKQPHLSGVCLMSLFWKSCRLLPHQ